MACRFPTRFDLGALGTFFWGMLRFGNRHLSACRPVGLSAFHVSVVDAACRPLGFLRFLRRKFSYFFVAWCLIRGGFWSLRAAGPSWANGQETFERKSELTTLGRLLRRGFVAWLFWPHGPLLRLGRLVQFVLRKRNPRQNRVARLLECK